MQFRVAGGPRQRTHESRWIHDQIYCLKFETPQSGRPDSRIHFPQEKGRPVTPPGIAFV